jgi:hypothetical protein
MAAAGRCQRRVSDGHSARMKVRNPIPDMAEVRLNDIA